MERVTPDAIRARKGGQPIVCLTAYTTPVAQRLDAHVDLMLVGDSVAMVVYGMGTTRDVTLETMIAHGAAVVRGAKRACVIIDLPRGSYERSPQHAYASASQVMDRTGAQGVKMEGGVELVDTIEHLVDRGIPVMGHVGLLPQRVTHRRDFKIQGRDEQSWQRVFADGRAVAEAGAFALVIEGTVEPLARALTDAVAIPTIGIGASPACDGQILVTDDLLGLFSDFTPTFVKRYAELGESIERAASAYADDVRARRFPGPEHTFGEK
ncbi:MAG: 3-methyl-2-oxobutanoate hydroxymethyltransferase [Longimicrobiales bacterium]